MAYAHCVQTSGNMSSAIASETVSPGLSFCSSRSEWAKSTALEYMPVLFSHTSQIWICLLSCFWRGVGAGGLAQNVDHCSLSVNSSDS